MPEFLNADWLDKAVQASPVLVTLIVGFYWCISLWIKLVEKKLEMQRAAQWRQFLEKVMQVPTLIEKIKSLSSNVSLLVSRFIVVPDELSKINQKIDRAINILEENQPS